MQNNLDNITFISDEVSQDLNVAIEFAHYMKLNKIELRTINGINILNLKLNEIYNIANKIHSNNLIVTCFASPLLKWLPNNKLQITNNVRSHGFNKENKTDEQLFKKTFKIANILQSKYIRIFSYIRYDNFQLNDLKQAIDQLINLAIINNKIILMENEPVCNIATIEQLTDFFKTFKSKHLKCLLDIGNLFETALTNNIDIKNNIDLLLTLPPDIIEYFHCKDYDISNMKFVALGDGDVPYEYYFKEFKKIINLTSKIISMETHVAEGHYNATLVSIQKLKNYLGSNFISES